MKDIPGRYRAYSLHAWIVTSWSPKMTTNLMNPANWTGAATPRSRYELFEGGIQPDHEVGTRAAIAQLCRDEGTYRRVRREDHLAPARDSIASLLRRDHGGK